ncbi:hypothetical protein ACFQOZ_15740 [Comamonas endophytica]|uniref:hypothetical protein n=1 Tax=Comamonas endophytica TaxID=2949090 RepID=UPI003607A864
MNYSVSPPGSPHASMPLLPQEPVTDEAEKDLPGSICGMGAAQGTLVAVGDGLARKVLHQDARMAEAPGDDDDDDIDDVFYEMDGTPEDIAGLDGNVSSEKDEDAALHNPVRVRLDSADGHQDVESGNATRAVGRSLDTIEEHLDTTAGTHSEMALFVVDDKGRGSARRPKTSCSSKARASTGKWLTIVEVGCRGSSLRVCQAFFRQRMCYRQPRGQQPACRAILWRPEIQRWSTQRMRRCRKVSMPRKVACCKVSRA